MFSKLLFNPLKPIMQEYFVAIIRVEGDDILSDNYQETIRECFSIIRKHNGDVNQFMGSVILALFGVPLKFGDVKQNCINLLEELKERKIPVSIIVKQDYGLYGSIGDENRAVVTALSENIIQAMKEIINCDSRTVRNEIEGSK
jgi:class 3 adenylate cyclase